MKKISKIIWGVKCVVCNVRLFSFHRHDYKLCGCSNETMVDGGREYLRYGWLVLKPKRIKWSDKKDGEYPVVHHRDIWPY